MGFWRKAFCLWIIRSADSWGGTPGRTMVRLSLPSGLSHTVHEVSARHDRARACQRSRRQLLLGSVLVSERTSRNFPFAAGCRAAAAARLACLEHSKIRKKGGKRRRPGAARVHTDEGTIACEIAG